MKSARQIPGAGAPAAAAPNPRPRPPGSRIGADAGSLGVPAASATAAPPLRAADFPEATPLNAFVAWNEARRATDRRYRVACDIRKLLQGAGGDVCLAHLAGAALGLRRSGDRIVASPIAAARAREFVAEAAGSPALAAARRLIESLRAALGSAEIARHAAVFRAFEELAEHVDLEALARLRPQPSAARLVPRPRRILIVKLGALGDFIQALGPVPEIRRHHSGDRLSLLTTHRYAEIARQTGLFDDVLVDRRPHALDLLGWLALRHMLRREHFDRVYDFQTADRSNIYSRLLRRGALPEWSGTARHCSHPHANFARDRQHTMDRQAEQLLMAGVYPVSRMPWLPAAGVLPAMLAGRRFAMLIPGSSPRRPEKRWPADRYGELAHRLARAGYLPAIVGVGGEQKIGRAIRAVCPEAVDLVGQTDVAGLAALARAAALTIGNDTGATHVAAAGGNPVVVLFSQASSPSLCAPRGAAVRVLIEPDLADLAVETVLAAGLALAAGESAAAAAL
jgi:ADP-heptose:LPS heptosyltransferase